jgi:hypothetical protein
MKKLAICAILALVLAAGCAKNTTGNLATMPMGAVRNPVDFPVYPNSIPVGVAAFDQAEIARTLKKNNPGKETEITPYKGNEVLLRSTATLAQLEAWLSKMRAAPPQGLAVRDSGSSDTQLNDWGVEAATFGTQDKKREVFVLVMDPKKVYEKVGPAIDMIDKYKALPAMVRGGIESQVKKQLGISVDQMLDKSNPVGMALWGVKELHGSGQRAIVLLDAVKE